MIGTVKVRPLPAGGLTADMDVHAGDADRITEDEFAWSRYMDHAEPALLWLAARGGGTVVLPLGDGAAWHV